MPPQTSTAKQRWYWAHYQSDGCRTGIRASVGFASDGDSWYVKDRCADGHAVAVKTSFGWTKYHRGGSGTQAVVRRNYREGRTFSFRACVEFRNALRCGPRQTATA
ncbi:hypothetical protein AQ490_21440 [Wenjunlia vitaminophila]|uniref:Uncharacterized protein n=1 Tax=Wenjunlia vitaminophila TaxID=76728 RepID=A0A0T6LSY4_WENVI|nr:hypothetical protein [Wenjunlia vitaminophila]KRV49173.1 hypothetical protein AQ490_21440 [Wenjunlia vitaminophila]